MKAIEFSPHLDKKLRKLRKENPALLKKIQKQLTLFQKDPTYKSLRLHKLAGGLKSVWSISINKSVRMLYEENETIYFFDVGTHEEVYK